MSKRSWSVANAAQGLLDMNSGSGRSATGAPLTSPSQNNAPQDSMTPPERPNGPQISRKVKACAACRKQKIKCLMDNAEPPCRRCVERNLSCVLNKSLQTLISERSQWKDDMHRDLSNVHGAVQDILKKLSLPAIQPLTTTDRGTSPFEDVAIEKIEDAGPSCDNSPKLTPRNQSLQNVPIESLYQITRLRSLRAENAGDESGATVVKAEGTDVISKGIISLDDAERLTTLYLRRLDHYAYSIANKFSNLQSIRRRSAALTAAICAVSALHDPNSNHLFEPCCRELKRILAESMFDRRIDREYLRAMCIGSYWLSDISWTLSGHAIRRAMGINLSSNYHRVLADNSEDAADCLRLWYLLFICDQHLSILYGRSTIMSVDDPTILGWEDYLEKGVAVEQDRRMASQVALLVIMGNIREFFEKHKGKTLPQDFTEHITAFELQLDNWFPLWFQKLKIHDNIGDFPSKGVVLHYNLAKLHLHSNVFRGLADSLVPNYFRNSAVKAVEAATTIVEVLLSDIDLRTSLVGMPHYLHTMIAFACGFLLQMTTKYDGDIVQRTFVHDLVNRLVLQLRSMQTGKWHLIRFMTQGLEKMVEASMRTPTQPPAQLFNGGFQFGSLGLQGGNCMRDDDKDEATTTNTTPPYDFLTDQNQQQDFGLAGRDDGSSSFMIPDFGLSNSFLPFDDPNTMFRSAEFGLL